MRNYLTFGGKDSRDFGVYISGQGTFSAPEKAYTFYSIPGRSGALIGNEKRLENIEVSYECFIYSNFSQNIADFRSYLLSLDGYQELTDSYHPDEFRMACYVGPFEPEVTTKNDAGSFTLTFNCKPQRYLYSGLQKVTLSGTMQTKTGVEVLAYGPALSPAIDSNLNPVSGGNYSYVHNPTFSLIIDGIEKRSVSLTADATKASIEWSTGKIYLKGVAISYRTTSAWIRDSGNTYRVFASSLYSGNLASSPVFVFPNENRKNALIWGVSFDSGTGYITLYTRTNYTDLNSFKAAMSQLGNPMFIAYFDLITSVATSFSPYYATGFTTWANIKTLANGETTDNLTTTVAESGVGTSVINPTLFPAKPILRISENGVINMNGVSITVTNNTSTYVDIDCEIMDCYTGTTNRNADVSFSTYDFPALMAGENTITITTGSPSLELQPRWWLV